MQTDIMSHHDQHDDTTKNARLEIRLSKSQKAQIKYNASIKDMTVSEYILAYALPSSSNDSPFGLVGPLDEG